MRGWTNWTLQTASGVGQLFLNRAEHNNSLNPQVLAELKEIAELDFAALGIRALVLEGTGRHFSVGMDLSVIEELAAGDAAEFEGQLEAMQSALDAFDAIPIPVVAAIRGFCIGGGMLLAACCDLRIAAAKSFYSMPEVRMGIGVALGMHRLLRCVSLPTATELVLLGERFDVATALDIGFVSEITQPADVHTEALRFANRLSALPASGVQVNKRLLRAAAALPPAESQRMEIDTQLEGLGRPEFLNILREYVRSVAGGRERS